MNDNHVNDDPLYFCTQQSAPLCVFLTSIPLFLLIGGLHVKLWEEASARTLVVLDADGWKYHFHGKHIHTGTIRIQCACVFFTLN